MNAAAIRTSGRYLGAWGAIVLCVILLSVIFNFLGTITCAVLVGMMMGVFKGTKWFSVSVSLVFPGVILGLVRGARVELSQQQVLMLGALCFGAFWVTYLVSAYVFFCEQKGAKAPRPSASAPQLEPLLPGGQAVATGGTLAAELTESAAPFMESCLKQLEGSWVCETAGAGEPSYKKIIQIREAKLELRAVDPSGRTTLLATGDVTLQGVRAS